MSQISHGSIFFEYDGCNFVFKEPTASTIFNHYRRRESEKTQCEKEGFLTKEQEDQMLKDNGLWIEGFEEKMSGLIEDMQKLQKNKSSLRFRSGEKRAVERTIRAIKTEIERMQNAHKTFYSQTIEYQSDLRCKYRLLQECLYGEDDSLVWPSWDDFEEDTDLARINGLLSKAFFESTVSESQYRELARSEPWRSTWRVSCKTGTPIFSHAACEFTASQKTLTYWSAVYDNVYESADCPDSSVIDDDDALDAWFEDQAAKVNKSRSERLKNNDSVVTNKKIANSNEVFIPVNSREDAQKVYNELNTPTARNNFAKRQSAISKKGVVKETEMPDTVQEIKMAYTRMENNKLKQG